MDDDMVEIGRVIKTHGIRGELVVDPTTDVPDERFAVGERLVGRRGRTTVELVVEAVRWHKNRLLVRCEGVSDRTAAESYRGCRFIAPPREDEDYYDDDLVGLSVVSEGETIGTVSGVTRGVAHNLLEIDLIGGHAALVPFVDAIVPDVDVAAGIVRITPPEGLLDLP